MSRHRGLWVVCSVVLPLWAAGCKTTELTVINDTDADAHVSLEGPGIIQPDSTLPVASSGEALFTVMTPHSKLPANYEWQGAGRAGTIVVDKQSDAEQILHLSTGAEATP